MIQCHRHDRSCYHGFQPMEVQSADEAKCRRYDSGISTDAAGKSDPKVPSGWAASSRQEVYFGFASEA